MALKKTDNNNIITARVSPDVKKKLKARAKKEERPVSYIINKILSQAIA